MRTALFSIVLFLSSPVLAFEGTYASQGGDWRQTAVISKRPDGNFDVKLEVTTPRCVGEANVVGRVGGDLLTTEKDDEGLICSVAIRRTALGIDVKEFTCELHGHRCGFEGHYTRVGNSAKASPPPKLAGRFYCAEEINLDPAHRKDRNYRLKPIEPGQTLSVGYDFYYHDGAFTYSTGGESGTTRQVAVAIAGDVAVYTARNGARWTVSPVGGRTVTIRGTGVPEGIAGYACAWR